MHEPCDSRQIAIAPDLVSLDPSFFSFLSLGRKKELHKKHTHIYIYISYTHFLFAPLEEQRPYSFRDGGREEKMKRNEMTRETPCYV